MTLVTLIQVLFAAGALLMFVESRAARSAGRSASARARQARLEQAEDYDYQPLLMIRWDDETDFGHRRPCDRDQVSRVRTARRRSVPVVIEVH